MANNERDSGGQPLGKQTQYRLPDELWENILSKLTLKDNIRASAVSKRFLSIATLVQKTDKPPLLMLKPECGDSYEFFDPFDHKSYWLDLPELSGARFHQSKDGWLLMSDYESEILFLFCPHTRELIQLPELPNLDYIPLYHKLITFSAAPTSPSCMVFILDRCDMETFQISKCRPGDPEWTNVSYETMTPLPHNDWENLIFCKGLLYCFNYNGLAVIYNPTESSWTVQDTQYPIYTEFFSTGSWFTKKMMGEYNGDIIEVFIISNRSMVILKLDLPNKTWVKLKFLGGNALFTSRSSSHVRTDLLGNKRNYVYFSEVNLPGNSCVLYSFDNGRFLPKNESYCWKGRNISETIWIDAPKDHNN